MIRKWLQISAVALAGLLACFLIYPYMAKTSDEEGWPWSANNLHQIGQALRSYHDAYGHLPPAVKHDKDGKPLYSWRVMLLPFVEEQRLFEQFHLDEPWDSPHNRTLLEKIPRCYQLPFDNDRAAGRTHYQVFVGPGTAFERDGLTWDDFSDGLADTLFVVEATNTVLWTAPVDLPFAPNVLLPRLGGIYRKPVHFLRREISRHAGFNACCVDGKTHFIRGDIDERNLRALITRNGGEKVNWSKID